MFVLNLGVAKHGRLTRIFVKGYVCASHLFGRDKINELALLINALKNKDSTQGCVPPPSNLLKS